MPKRSLGPPRVGDHVTSNSTPWYRDEQCQGALVSWTPIAPDGTEHRGILLGAKRIRSGDPRSIRTALEVMELGTGTIYTVETWQARQIV